MDNRIRHDGLIESIDGEHITVRIVQMSACASCHVADKCHTSESKVKMIDVWTKNYSRYQVGQKVVVLAESKVGMLAVLIGFVVPVLLVLLAVVLGLFLTSADGLWHVEEPYNQAYAALGGLVILIPYYYVVYLNRDALQTRLAFSLA